MYSKTALAGQRAGVAATAACVIATFSIPAAQAVTGEPAADGA
ncbi:hypothetical protein [Kitasatospora sp. NPDC091276]